MSGTCPDRAVGPGAPLDLEDPAIGWRIVTGALEIEAVRLDEAGRMTGSGRHLLRLEAETVAFGIAPVPLSNGERVSLRARAMVGTRVIAVAPAREVDHLESWLMALTAIQGAAGTIADVIARPATPFTLTQGQRVIAPRGSVYWLSVSEGQVDWSGAAAQPVNPGTPPVALTDGAWAVAGRTSICLVRDTAALVRSDELALALARVGAAMLGRFGETWLAEDAARAARIMAGRDASSRLFAGGLARFARVLQPADRVTPDPEATADALTAALGLVARAAGITTRIAAVGPGEPAERIETALRAAGIPSRRVLLRPGWHGAEAEPTLGLMRFDEDAEPTPVALLPDGCRYRFVDPARGREGPVTEALLDRIHPHAWVLFRTLPDGDVSIPALVRFGLLGGRRDVIRVTAAGLAGALLALVMPMVTAPLFSDVLPRADQHTFAAILFAMAVATLGHVTFELVRGFASLRLGGRMETEVQAAIWDRVLRLPTGFFRGFSTGDLATRVTSIAAIRAMLSSAVISTTLTAVFSVTSLGVMAWHSGWLTLIAIGMMLVAVAATVVFTWLQFPHQRAAMDRHGKLVGLTLQILLAIAKLRVGGAEARLFARWATLYAEQKTDTMAARRIAAVQSVFAHVFGAITTMAIFAATIWLGVVRDNGSHEPLLSIGAYMAFNAALGQFLGSIMAVVGTGARLVSILPMMRRVRPILTTSPETRSAGAETVATRGEIEFQGVSFRYNPEGPNVLDKVSFRILPGQHVAIVGPSGSGKSTIVRLILGFERPGGGAVLHDGRDLATLDVRAVRRQAGIVLQNGALTNGSILDNIIGSSPLTLDDAWEAARLAGLDRDIQVMPMGMRTMLSDGGGTISGGQRQRLLIARALVRRPRLIIFDEATSALDNRAQALVIANLAAMNATRIVVAHRLSTIRDADRILVMQDGRLVEEGRYDALIRLNGLFAELVRRQA